MRYILEYNNFRKLFDSFFYERKIRNKEFNRLTGVNQNKKKNLSRLLIRCPQSTKVLLHINPRIKTRRFPRRYAYQRSSI